MNVEVHAHDGEVAICARKGKGMLVWRLALYEDSIRKGIKTTHMSGGTED
jgi:hypothetical protein